MAAQKTLQASARQLDGRADSKGLSPNCLYERQRKFAAALLDPTMPVPCGLVGPIGSQARNDSTSIGTMS